MLEKHMRTGSRGSKRLEDRTIYLHGTIMRFKCSLVESHCGVVTNEVREAWSSGTITPCLDCIPFNSFGRRISAGILVPDIELYNSYTTMKRISSITDHQKLDLRDVNCLIVVGTSLRREVLGAAELVKDFCGSVRKNRGKSFWINPNPPSKNSSQFFDYQILRKSDDVFSEVFSYWKPTLKPLRIGHSNPPESSHRLIRNKPIVDYSGLDRINRKSRKELEAQSRLKKRKINNLIICFIDLHFHY